MQRIRDDIAAINSEIVRPDRNHRAHYSRIKDCRRIPISVQSTAGEPIGIKIPAIVFEQAFREV